MNTRKRSLSSNAENVESTTTRAQRRLEETRRMREAVKEAIDEHRRLGQSIVIAREGTVIWLKPGEY